MESSNYQKFQSDSKDELRRQAYNHIFFSKDLEKSLFHLWSFQNSQGILANQEGFSEEGFHEALRILLHLKQLCENSGYHPLVSLNVSKYILYLQKLSYSKRVDSFAIEQLMDKKAFVLAHLIQLNKYNRGNYRERFCQNQIAKYSKDFLDTWVRSMNYGKEAQVIHQISSDFLYTKLLIELGGKAKGYFFFEPKFLDYCQMLLNTNNPLLKEPEILETIWYILTANKKCATEQQILAEKKLGENLESFVENNQHLRKKILSLRLEQKYPNIMVS